MKTFILFVVLASSSIVGMTQTFRTVTTDRYVPPTFNSSSSAGDLVQIIIEVLEFSADFACMDDLSNSLKEKIDASILELKKTIPLGSTVKMRAFISRSGCKVFALVPLEQMVRVNPDQCSIEDIPISYQPQLYDPFNTVFFDYNIKVE